MHIVMPMRSVLVALSLALPAGAALSQVAGQTADQPQANDKSGNSTGRTTAPETLGQKQPQGWTGPIETKSGGAPAESPQGQSPPGMQPAPEGSSKTTVAPDKK